jgi:hypothetical protein
MNGRTTAEQRWTQWNRSQFRLLDRLRFADRRSYGFMLWLGFGFGRRRRVCFRRSLSSRSFRLRGRHSGFDCFGSRRRITLRLSNRAASAITRRDRCERLAAVIPAQLIGYIFIDGARVRNLFGDAQLVELVDDLARLHFELPRQLIDSNLTHVKTFVYLTAPARRLNKL